LRFCDVQYPWRTAVKAFGTVGLPWGLDAAATFQSNPGLEVMANYQATNAVVQGLGRNLTSTPTVPLIYPGTVFGDRIYQLDLRLTKGIQFRTLRARLILDIANALNGNTVLVQNNTYGVNWLQPTYILPGRLIKPTIEINF
jgi:hypothetical protein